MNVNRNGYFQSAVEELAPSKTLARTERIDVVAGSARKGQSYLFWKGDELFQLPVTFWTETNSWVNSLFECKFCATGSGSSLISISSTSSSGSRCAFSQHFSYWIYYK